MKQIKLVMDYPFHNNVDISIIDLTGGKERRRGGITAEYARIDVKQYQDKGMDLEEVMEEYNNWIDRTLRRYLLDDCDVVSGREELLQTIREHIEGYF